MWPYPDRLRPAVAVAGGFVVTLALAAAIAPLHDDTTRAVPALLLIVPVVGAAVVGGRVPAFVVAAFATFAFTFALPPIGSPRVRVGEDVVALAVFCAVAFIVSALVTTKVAAMAHVDARRRSLLRSVSHDLRTPLSALQAIATDLRSGTVHDDVTQARLLDTLVDETARLDRFVANLLSMSRIDAGTLRPDLRAVDVGEVVERAARRFERAGTHPITLDVRENLPYVHADELQLEQVLDNLLDNVVRHTPDGTHARVSARADDDAVAIEVADDGPGLPDAVQRSLAGDAVDASTGFGLPICRAILELHGGVLLSRTTPRGTAMTVVIPRGR
jgi:two-component system sensor histidine kinase KdpD